jgi:serine/threonine protein kinase
MGRVYKAVHKKMNRTVALKLLAPQLVKTAKAKELFQSEVRAAARLIHPNIVTAYDANEEGDRHYLVMEYVDGPNLDQLVRERGPLPVGLACEIIRQAALGLQYAHEMNMVHRDIKPANLLVQLTGKNQDLAVKILDFGLARLQEPGRDASAPDRSIMGTPDFLSPEQGANSQDVDIRSDLYSLGCTFYYLLTKRVPFPGGSAVEKLDRQKNEEPVPVEEGRPEIPGPVASIVRRLMAKYPPHRFQKPEDLAAAVAPFAAAGSPSLSTGPLDGERAMPTTGLGHGDKSSDAGVGTLPPDFSATPLSSLGLRAPWEEAHKRRRLKALFVAIGLVAALVVGLAAVLIPKLIE